jgi:hypothetical protein
MSFAGKARSKDLRSSGVEPKLPIFRREHDRHPVVAISTISSNGSSSPSLGLIALDFVAAELFAGI